MARYCKANIGGSVNTRGKLLICFNCGLEGHISTQCEKRLQECSICKKKGHTEKRCYYQKKKSDDKPIEEGVLWSFGNSRVEIDVDGMEAILDTGCNKNLVGEL